MSLVRIDFIAQLERAPVYRGIAPGRCPSVEGPHMEHIDRQTGGQENRYRTNEQIPSKEKERT